MPSFSSPSSIRVASQDHVLRLKITHGLVHGLPSDAVHIVKGRLPKELDVLWLSDISIVLSGSLDGREIPAHDIARSRLVFHLQTQLKANADRLGLGNVSHPFVDDVDGLSKLTLTPSRPLPDASRPHANLVSLHLAYIWRSVTRRNDVADSGRLVEDINPFSPALFLPAETLLNRATEQFLIYHLVSRYPLIFGPWCKRLDLEMPYFPSIGHSIVEMMNRSPNPRFLSKCKRLLKIARRDHKFVLQTASAALSACTDDTASETLEEEMNCLPAISVLTDEQVLCQSLEQLFRMGVSQRRFKPATRNVQQLPQDDDESLLQCIPISGIEDENSWAELSEIATSMLIEPYQTSPEDIDIFADEDWVEGGMWRLHDADDDQSDESLINDSITTSSFQAGAVALYHHQVVDHREPNSVGGGLRYKISQLAYSEDAETSAVLTRTASHERHDPHYSENHEQVMAYVGTCQVDPDDFETLDSGFDRDELTDSDSILLEVDVADDTDVDEPLVWM